MYDCTDRDNKKGGKHLFSLREFVWEIYICFLRWEMGKELIFLEDILGMSFLLVSCLSVWFLVSAQVFSSFSGFVFFLIFIFHFSLLLLASIYWDFWEDSEPWALEGYFMVSRTFATFVLDWMELDIDISSIFSSFFFFSLFSLLLFNVCLIFWLPVVRCVFFVSIALEQISCSTVIFQVPACVLCLDPSLRILVPFWHCCPALRLKDSMSGKGTFFSHADIWIWGRFAFDNCSISGLDSDGNLYRWIDIIWIFLACYIGCFGINFASLDIVLWCWDARGHPSTRDYSQMFLESRTFGCREMLWLNTRNLWTMSSEIMHWIDYKILLYEGWRQNVKQKPYLPCRR